MGLAVRRNASPFSGNGYERSCPQDIKAVAVADANKPIDIVHLKSLEFIEVNRQAW